MNQAYSIDELAHAIADDICCTAERDRNGDGWVINTRDHEIRFVGDEDNTVRISIDDRNILLYRNQSYHRVLDKIELALSQAD